MHRGGGRSVLWNLWRWRHDRALLRLYLYSLLPWSMSSRLSKIPIKTSKSTQSWLSAAFLQAMWQFHHFWTRCLHFKPTNHNRILEFYRCQGALILPTLSEKSREHLFKLEDSRGPQRLPKQFRPDIRRVKRHGPLGTHTHTNIKKYQMIHRWHIDDTRGNA